MFQRPLPVIPVPAVRRMRAAPLLLGLALALAAPACPAQPAMGLTRPPAKDAPTKACVAAGVKMQREQQSLDAARADLDRYTAARAACTTKSACARNDDRITALNKRIPRHVARLAEFKALHTTRCAAPA
jgi:hypothetical protein